MIYTNLDWCTRGACSCGSFSGSFCVEALVGVEGATDLGWCTAFLSNSMWEFTAVIRTNLDGCTRGACSCGSFSGNSCVEALLEAFVEVRSNDLNQSRLVCQGSLLLWKLFWKLLCGSPCGS